MEEEGTEAGAEKEGAEAASDGLEKGGSKSVVKNSHGTIKASALSSVNRVSMLSFHACSLFFLGTNLEPTRAFISYMH